jgi:hypothetical protein
MLTCLKIFRGLRNELRTSNNDKSSKKQGEIIKMPFQKGNTYGTGRPKGMKNKLTNDVRQIFHEAYESMGKGKLNEKGEPMTGKEAFLRWAQENQTEFYRLYGKMIPTTQELTGDLHEDFVDSLVFEEEEAKLVEAVIVEDEGQKQLPSGEANPINAPQSGKTSAPPSDPDLDMV